MRLLFAISHGKKRAEKSAHRAFLKYNNKNKGIPGNSNLAYIYLRKSQ